MKEKRYFFEDSTLSFQPYMSWLKSAISTKSVIYIFISAFLHGIWRSTLTQYLSITAHLVFNQCLMSS